jgi:hypothetical protein
MGGPNSACNRVLEFWQAFFPCLGKRSNNEKFFKAGPFSSDDTIGFLFFYDRMCGASLLS